MKNLQNTPKSSRRKPKQERASQTVDIVLEAAAQVLLREGYARATTNRIAERAGVSVGSLYQYFAGKDAIFAALLDRAFDRRVAAIHDDPLDPGQPLAAAIDHLVRLALRVWPRGPEILHHLEQVPGSDFRRRSLRAKKELRAVLVGLFAGHRDELRVADLELAVHVLVGAAEGILYEVPRGTDLESLGTEISNLAVRYLLNDGSLPARASRPDAAPTDGQIRP